ncbi:unnamed protein product [Microthlaspi erraticum]|uniref:AIG1-type G domain-containing protein n=1 Tax=Microthlaspi erraticum TaxID=1685480 RepID=A0A6D2J8B1_9BRAS|nr:unnamed protein product [Microthlaspi erraticum]
MAGGLAADDSSDDDLCDLSRYDNRYWGSQQRPARTLVLLGCSGNGKSATGNSILGRDAFESKGRAAAVTKECVLQNVRRANGQIINVIDTPGLFSLLPSNEATIREILKCSRLAKEGINAVLMVLSLRNRLTEEEKSALLVLKILFGSDIVDYMILVFTNEDSLDDNSDTMKDYLEECPDFKEILTACNNRMVLFDNRPKADKNKKAEQVQELLSLVEEVMRKNNNKPFMVDFSHDTKENEAAFEEKHKKIKALKGQCTKQEKEEAEDSLHQLSRKVETKLIKTTNLLEKKLNEEQAARLEAEERARKLHKESSDEIKRLTEKLEKAEKELEKQGGSCIVL